jgi:hypothetical protein
VVREGRGPIKSVCGVEEKGRMKEKMKRREERRMNKALGIEIGCARRRNFPADKGKN